MTKDYQRPVACSVHEIEIKNSRFIAIIAPAFRAEDCAELLNRAQTEWPKASHYCTASIVGSPTNQPTLASSDDGEPSGTAGRPMLMVLQNAGLGDIAAVVVRYFGGTKLGTGGLQRAYSQSVAEALETLKTELVVYRCNYQLSYPYELQGNIESLWKQFDIRVVQSDFAERVKQTVGVIPEQLDALQAKLDAVSQGQVKLTLVD
ncbi:MAG: YigZ family protein [Idiomarina sp.]|mgnify:CR=1 FL=1|nr:YigZ family protein [Idiomarinaceae bacterium]MBL4742972.1 YigZ family protein [Idiomarina sp.]PHQ72693.1 MAG: YigZ family protein [Idiomarina sp.]